ncbi:chemotaxis protein CheW [Undibacterium sp. RuRC25W]|uniref:chemotaxis protein CheW n=1 Tax=Undibacterium sp. RuRC25W TaxID=3413047 RepID=UPI003BF21193
MTQNLSDAVTANQDVSKPDSGVRRTRLREFQAQLVERMQAAQRGEFVQVNQLGIMVGQVRYLLELRESGEIVSASSLTTVPLTKDWYVGLANIRGNLTSVVDLPRYQGRDMTQLDSSCRIVAFASVLAFNSGLLVSQVLGLRNIAEMEEVTSPEDTSDIPAWVQSQYRDREGNVWYKLSLAALVQDQGFLQIGL